MTSPAKSSAIGAFALRLGAQLSLFAVLERLVLSLGRLDERHYQSAFFLAGLPSQLLGLLSRHPVLPTVVALGMLVVLGFPAGRSAVIRVFDGWGEVEGGTRLRVLIGFITGIAAWTGSTYAYNAWFGHTHGWDRLFLLTLWALSLWRPVFLLPFAVAFAAVLAQFEIPLQRYSRTEIELLLRVAVLASSFWIVRAFGRERTGDTLLFLLFCLVAVTYWWSGLGKLRINWLTHARVDLMPLMSHIGGWVGFLDIEVVTRISQRLAPFNLPIKILTLLVECGALFLLVRRRGLIAFLLLAPLFHLGIFLFSGILFWKWILVEAALLVFLLRGKYLASLSFFTPKHALLSLLVILGVNVWTNPVSLTWYETPLVYSIRIEGEGVDGRRYPIPATTFGPHVDTFVLGSFPYLPHHAQLTGSGGATQDLRLAKALLGTRDPAVVVEHERGLPDPFDPTLSEAFREFVRRFVLHAADSGRAWWSRLGAPRHLWNFPHREPWEGQTLVRLHISEETWFYDGESMDMIRKLDLGSVEL